MSARSCAVYKFAGKCWEKPNGLLHAWSAFAALRSRIPKAALPQQRGLPGTLGHIVLPVHVLQCARSSLSFLLTEQDRSEAARLCSLSATCYGVKQYRVKACMTTRNVMADTPPPAGCRSLLCRPFFYTGKMDKNPTMASLMALNASSRPRISSTFTSLCSFFL